MENLIKCIFRASRRKSFSYFPNTAFDCGCAPRYLLEFLWIMLPYWFKPYAASKMELFVIKKGNSWELLLTVVTESLVLNVKGLLDPTLKRVDKFRLRQYSILSTIYMFKVSRNRIACQIYSKLTIKTPE